MKFILISNHCEKSAAQQINMALKLNWTTNVFCWFKQKWVYTDRELKSVHLSCFFNYGYCYCCCCYRRRYLIPLFIHMEISPLQNNFFFPAFLLLSTNITSLRLCITFFVFAIRRRNSLWFSLKILLSFALISCDSFECDIYERS